MAEFYSARGWEIPPLPWTNLSPPFSPRSTWLKGATWEIPVQIMGRIVGRWQRM